MKIKDYKIKGYEGVFGCYDDTGCPKNFEAEITEGGTLEELVDDVAQRIIPNHGSWDYPFFIASSPRKQIIDEQSKMAAISIHQSHGVSGGTLWASGIYAITVDKTKATGKLIAFDFDRESKYGIVSLENDTLEYSEGESGYTKRCNLKHINQKADEK